MSITFETKVKVRLDGKYIGDIKSVKGGYQYFPKGSKSGGDIYPRLELCKNSL